MADCVSVKHFYIVNKVIIKTRIHTLTVSVFHRANARSAKRGAAIVSSYVVRPPVRLAVTLIRSTVAGNASGARFDGFRSPC